MLFRSDNKTDYKGQIAGIIFYIIKRLVPADIKIEFNFDVVSTKLDGIQYVIMHGHNKEATESAEKIILNYGQQGLYNFIVTGHLHSLQIKSDSNMHRHMICPSVFPGNDWSERKGWVSNQGFLIAYNNGTDKPEVIISPI